MDLFALPPLTALVDLAYAGMMALTALIEPLAGASAAAAAVVLVTVLVRAALIPAGIAQARAEQTRARLAPRLRDLQRRHRQDPERLQRETMRLYRDENTSPFAGCLPILIQTPIVGVLYAIFLHATIAGHPNELLAETLFGVPLGAGLAATFASGTADAASAAVLGGLVLLIAMVGELSRRLLRVSPPPSGEGSGLPPVPARLLGLMQFATAGVAVFVPLAAALYLLVTVSWSLVQRLILRRAYPQ